MATTPTNKPIPSEDPRDLKFNAGKIDEEVNGSADYYTDRFSVQRLTNTGRNNQFQDQMNQQADDWLTQFNQQESDFQQFLLNSGYQFLGDYENGPYTIMARNQIIRYQNEFWRLNAATNPPYTTTGVNSTSWTTDVTHLVSVGDATLRQELASSIGFSLIGKISSISALTSITGMDGQRILVESFYSNWRTTGDGKPHGGGEFYYDSTKSSINNGVTIFNGWCRRDISTLSTWDAGLIPDDNTDASQKLQAIFDAMPAGCTVEIDGRHCTTRVIHWSSKDNIKIKPKNGGFIDALTLKDNFEFILVDGWQYYAPSTGATQGYPGGIISYLDSDNVEIGPGLKIRGPKKRFDKTSVDVTLRREYGDMAVQYRGACNNTKINGNDFRHFWSWIIYGSDGSDNSEANNNRIGDCALQSGINIWNGCSSCKANGNYIDETGLYGLEIETLDSQYLLHGTSKKVEAKNNRISNAKWGISVVRAIDEAGITGNTISSCLYGFNTVKNLDRGYEINFAHNTVMLCGHSAHTSGSQNVHIEHNVLSNPFKPDFLILNQYACIVGIETDRTQFRIFYSGNSGLTTSIQIRGVTYTVTNRTVVNDSAYTYGESRYVIVTVSQPLASDVEIGDTLYQSTEFINPTALSTSVLYQEDDSYVKGVVLAKNTISGYFYAAEQYETVFSDNNIAISAVDNRIVKTVNSGLSVAYRFARNSAWSSAIEYSGTNHTPGMRFLLSPATGSTLNTKALEVVRFSVPKLSLTAGTAFPINYFISDSDRLIIGADIMLSGVSSSSNIRLSVDGTIIYANVFTAAGLTSLSVFKDRTVAGAVALSANSGTGRHNVQLSTSDNSAVCAGYEITLYLL